MRAVKKHRINAVAGELGISIQTVRNYEEQGIIPRARRDEKGWRYYTDEDVLKIKALFTDELSRSAKR